MRRRIRVGLFATVGFGLVAVLGAGCRGATEVTLIVRTAADLPCSSVASVSIVIAATPEDAEARLGSTTLTAKTEQGTCDADGHTIGTLVVTPGDSAGAVVVAARLVGNESAPCAPPDYKGCIVARRTFTFVSHASVTLPVSLDISCLDVPCGVVTSCRSGTCVSSSADCSGDTGTCISPAEPDGPGTDAGGGADAADATDDQTARSDATLDGSDAYAPIDAGPVGCPVMAGGTSHCASDQVCCYVTGAFKCQTSCAGGTTFGCFGKGTCSGRECCVTSPNAVVCDPTASGEACSMSAAVICTSPADCPNGELCTTPFDGAMACTK